MEEGRFKDDRILIDACLNKDMLAWSFFVKKYSRLISVSIEIRLKKCGIAPARQDIEDIKQNILTSLWHDRKLETIRNRDGISYWLAIVSGNTAMGYMKHQRRQEPYKLVSLTDKWDHGSIEDLLPDGRSTQAQQASNGEVRQKVEDAFKSLSARERLIMRLHLEHGKKYGEIAGMLGIPGGTISSCIRRAKDKLRDRLKDFK